MALKATAQIVRNYQELFVNRRAYTMQSLRPHPETGRHYYFRPTKEGSGLRDKDGADVVEEATGHQLEHAFPGQALLTAATQAMPPEPQQPIPE